MQKVHDVFQRGLHRGAERLPFDPEKRYFYVEKPATKESEGWRVYLRACCFIHEKPVHNEAIDPMRFIVVKRTGKNDWEAPKGQMEGKDGLRNSSDSVLKILKENIKREVGEEARITKIQHLEHTGLVFEGRENDYPPNTFFQYHIFHALATPSAIQEAAEELKWYREHPVAFARLKRDKREKDDISFYSPSETRISGRWSPSIIAMYLKKYSQ